MFIFLAYALLVMKCLVRLAWLKPDEAAGKKRLLTGRGPVDVPAC